MHTLPSLSVFFPAYNEKANIPHLLEMALQEIPKIAEQYELIVVNDGSRDGTLAVVKEWMARHPEIRLVNHPKNLGYGAALKSGFEAARYQWIFFTDADLQFDLSELQSFVPFTNDYSAIIGYRKERAEGFGRARNAYLFKLFVDALYRVHVRDIDCAFKLFRTDVIKPLQLRSNGAFISAELLYNLKKNHVNFKQLPVTHYPRRHGNPTGANLRVITKAGWDALSLYFALKLGRLKQHQW